jgi:hypothetical protein
MKMHRPIDDILDRTLAASAAMCGVLCILVLVILLLRGTGNRGRRFRSTIDPVGGTRPIGGAGLLAAGRVGFAALLVRYSTTVLSRLGWVTWWTFTSDIVLLACDFGVLAAGIYAVRQTTYEVCGNRAVYVFGAIVLTVGFAVYSFG